jgi:hypothetical protein
MAASRKKQSNLSRVLNRKNAKPGAVMNAIKQAPSYKEFLHLTPYQVSKLKTDELRTMMARINKVEKKRVKNLEKYGYNSSALRGLVETGGTTKASKSMSRQELLHEYARAKSFLTSDTGTVAGAKNFIRGVSQMAGADRELTSDEVSRMYSILDKYKESGAIGFYKKGDKKSAGYIQSQATQQDIFDMMQQGQSDEEILANLGIMSRTEYEAMQDTSENFQWIGAHHP